MDETSMVLNSPMDNDEGGLWLALSQGVGGVLSVGQEPSASRLQATVRNVLAYFSDYEGTDPCFRTDCGHPYLSHGDGGECLVVMQRGWAQDYACQRYITEDDVQLEQLAGELSTLIDETEGGEGWAGSAAELASKVKRLIEGVHEEDVMGPVRRGEDTPKGHYRACGQCGNSPARHNPLNDDYMGHEYR